MLPRFLLNLSCFLLCALPLAVSASRWDRYPGVLGEKLRFYAEHRDAYDTLVFGSSYAHFGFDPAEFDATLRDRGIASRTFNLAVPGLMGHEIDETISLALDLDVDRRIQRVFIDLRPLDAGRHDDRVGSGMAVWWHSPRQTLAALRTLWRAPGPLLDKIALSAHHLGLALRNHLPLGTGRSLHEGPDAQAYTRAFREAFERHQGYEPLHDDSRTAEGFGRPPSTISFEMLTQRDRMLAEGPALEQRRRQVVRELERPALPADTLDLDFWKSQSDRLARRGILAVHVLMPAYRQTFARQATALFEQGAFGHFVSFQHPGTYPEFFAVEHRYEYGHLNHRGTLLFSESLAGETARLLNGEPSRILARPARP